MKFLSALFDASFADTWLNIRLLEPLLIGANIVLTLRILCFPKYERLWNIGKTNCPASCLATLKIGIRLLLWPGWISKSSRDFIFQNSSISSNCIVKASLAVNMQVQVHCFHVESLIFANVVVVSHKIVAWSFTTLKRPRAMSSTRTWSCCLAICTIEPPKKRSMLPSRNCWRTRRWEMACLLSDWKELETLPQCFKATGDQFFAQARHEISVWGALLCEHSDTSTSEKPEIMQTYIVVVSKILDHTALRTNQLIRIALKVKKSKKPWSSLALISDCGPHYRSMESLAHGLVYLHNAYDRIPIEIHFGCEKHMKSSIDRLFGWTKAILRRTVAGQKDLLEIEDVVTALRAGFAQNKKDNPAGPNVVVGLDDSPVPPLSQILSVKSKNFKISRSYCLSSAPSRLRPAEPRIFNHTFSSKPAAEEIDYELEQGEVPSAWRRGFWSASKSAWADKPKPLYPNEENTLSRRFLAQKHLLPSVLERRRQLLPDFAEEARRRQKRLNRARAAALRAQGCFGEGRGLFIQFLIWILLVQQRFCLVDEKGAGTVCSDRGPYEAMPWPHHILAKAASFTQLPQELSAKATCGWKQNTRLPSGKLEDWPISTVPTKQ